MSIAQNGALKADIRDAASHEESQEVLMLLNVLALGNQGAVNELAASAIEFTTMQKGILEWPWRATAPLQYLPFDL